MALYSVQVILFFVGSIILFLVVTTSSSIEHLPHGLVGQLDTEEGSGVGGNSTGQSRTETREESPVTALAVEVTDDAAERDVALGGLEAGLDGVDGEDGDPHGDAGGGTGAGDGLEAQLSGWLAGDGVLGAQGALDVLVGGEVGGRSGTVTGESGKAAAEDAADTTFAVELADNVEAAVVFGLLAGCEGLLALNLQDDLDTLKWGGNGGHGNGRQETGGGDLADAQAIRADGAGGGDNLLADIVTPEGDGD